MGNYYVLSVDSFVNTFSLMDSAKDFLFSLEKRNNSNPMAGLEAGDQVLVYRRRPVSKVSIVLEYKGAAGDRQKFQKLIEMADGVEILRDDVSQDIEEVEFIKIDEEKFREIYRRMASVLFANVRAVASRADVPRLTGAENVLLYGVPGAGKSHEIQEKYCDDVSKIERVVFHTDYTYSDFVGQILPRVEKEKLRYVFTPGPFTRLLKEAYDHPGSMYYLVIEEINRGNAPAVFGEIFQLLDRKTEDNPKYLPEEYGESEYGISNYEVAVHVYGDESHEVKIPSNMWVLATMNTADQNVFTLDTAFQRRWNMHHIKNDVMKAVHAGQRIEGTRVEWGIFATVINEMIIENNSDMASSEDKRLGAYFVKSSELTVDKFPEKVLKYLWDDAFQMDREKIFSDTCKSLEEVIELYKNAAGDKLQEVLSSEVYRKMSERAAQENEPD
ncbi:MAG: AAA family ATPase [Ruminococcus flavefaciens]|nr:AAA family ATPase [Ruminococcus flavefaciens]